jgi:hypothetical protein
LLLSDAELLSAKITVALLPRGRPARIRLSMLAVSVSFGLPLLKFSAGAVMMIIDPSGRRTSTRAPAPNLHDSARTASRPPGAMALDMLISAKGATSAALSSDPGSTHGRPLCHHVLQRVTFITDATDASFV